MIPRMTCVEVVHWGQLILASVIAVGFNPLLLWPAGWWTIALGVTLALTMLCMNIMAICYTSPAMKQAIQVNLNSESALRLFQERIMKNFALVFMFQIFVMALFIMAVFIMTLVIMGLVIMGLFVMTLFVMAIFVMTLFSEFGLDIS